MSEYTISGHHVDSDTKFEYRDNPKRNGCKAWQRYEAYKKATTIDEYLEVAEKKFAKADLRYDVEHHHLILTDKDGTVLNAPKSEEDKGEEVTD